MLLSLRSRTGRSGSRWTGRGRSKTKNRTNELKNSKAKNQPVHQFCSPFLEQVLRELLLSSHYALALFSEPLILFHSPEWSTTSKSPPLTINKPHTHFSIQLITWFTELITYSIFFSVISLPHISSTLSSLTDLISNQGPFDAYSTTLTSTQSRTSRKLGILTPCCSSLNEILRQTERQTDR